MNLELKDFDTYKAYLKALANFAKNENNILSQEFTLFRYKFEGKAPERDILLIGLGKPYHAIHDELLKRKAKILDRGKYESKENKGFKGNKKQVTEELLKELGLEHLKIFGTQDPSNLVITDFSKYLEKLAQAIQKGGEADYWLITHKFQQPSSEERKILLVGDEMISQFRSHKIAWPGEGTVLNKRFIPLRGELTISDLKSLNIDGTVSKWELNDKVPGTDISGNAMKEKIANYTKIRSSIKHPKMVSMLDDHIKEINKKLELAEAPSITPSSGFIKLLESVKLIESTRKSLDDFKPIALNAKNKEAGTYYLDAWDEFNNANFAGVAEKLAECKLFIKQIGVRMDDRDSQYDEDALTPLLKELSKTAPSVMFKDKFKKAVNQFSIAAEKIKQGKFNHEQLDKEELISAMASAKKILVKLGQGDISSIIIQIEVAIKNKAKERDLKPLLEKGILATQEQIDLINQDDSKLMHSLAREYFLLMRELNKQYGKLHHPN